MLDPPAAWALTWLHRFSVRRRAAQAFADTWAAEVTLRRRHGFVVHYGLLEATDEPKFTALYSHADDAAGATLATDPDWAALTAARAPLAFRNVLIRPVRVEALPPVGTAPDRLAILRRYSIVGDWGEFLGIWRRIVPVRQRHGFRLLFAVADEPTSMFTWAFDFAGEWADFAAAQRPYYADPDRVALRGVIDYFADYSVAPARLLPA